ncbi:hypothetical protein J6590_067114 [Homalodisca vitripennis]|nr:hypothetical protein J6590_067114 [Homalodisca vitripennis]
MNIMSPRYRCLGHLCPAQPCKSLFFGCFKTGLLWSYTSISVLQLDIVGQLFQVFGSQKKAVRILLKLNPRELCKDAFRSLGLLTLRCLFILEVILYCRIKCELQRGRDVHQYGTRGRDNFRLDQHRTTAYGRLPSQVGVRLINRLPEGIKNLNDPNQFD